MRFLVVLLLAADCAIAYLGMRSTGLTPGLHVGGLFYWALLAVFELPLLLLLGIQLARPGARAMVITAGTAITCALGLLPISLLMTLFSGFAMSIEQIYWLFYLWGFIGSLLATGGAAWFGNYRLRQPGESSRWVSAIYAPLLYVIAAYGVAFLVGNLETGTQQAGRDNTYKAKDALRKINQCATEAAKRPGAKGYPLKLEELGPAGTGCLDAQLAAGRAKGYAISYAPGLPGDDGRIAIYATCAMPADYPRGGGLTLASHEETDYVAENGDAKLQQPMACDRAWHYGIGAVSTLQNIKQCAILYARERPIEGYPASLSELRGFGCSIADKEVKYSAPPAAGRRPRNRFEALVGGSWHGRYGTFFVDETGVVRHEAKSEATRASTPLAVLAAAEAAAANRLRDQRAAAGAEALLACDAGDPQGCDARAEHLAFDGNKPDEAQRFWLRACDGGYKIACLSIFSSDPRDNESYHASMWFRRLCRDGNPRACAALPQIPPRASRDDIRKLEEWVRQNAS